MDKIERTTGADLKGAHDPIASPGEGVESRLVTGFIVVAALVIAGLVIWAM